jgi:hypothetical protein
MSFRELKNWVSSRTWVKNRIQGVCLWYLLFLMTPARKHSFQEVAKFSGLNKSQFSRALKNHLGGSVYTLDQLSKREAKRLAPLVKHLAKGALPWKTGLLIDSTLHQRSTLHTENAKRFNHGKGFVIGHQWTNIALFINEMIIPLPPIAFHSKKYCRKNNLKYKTENESVVEYLTQLNLQDYMGDHNPDEVVVLADSGYDDKKIENVIIQKGWSFIIAIKKTRSVKTEKQSCNSPKSKGWSHVAALFKDHRRTPWKTVRIFTDSPKRKRMDFRIRQIIGHLRYVGKAQLICSEFKKNTGGRIKYLACNDLKAKARQILIGYRLRWGIEIFHKEVKSYLGFQDVAAKSFTSVKAHVHWVYCAYILLHARLPGIPDSLDSLPDRQRKIKEIVDSKEKVRMIQLLTQINGVERCKNQLRQAIQ